MSKELKIQKFNALYTEIQTLIRIARDTVYRTANFEMVRAYWEIGKRIVEQEQHGEDRAAYGRYLIEELSKRLQNEFGKGFVPSNLWNMRQFYLTYPILDAVRRELSWTHYRVLMRIENPEARIYYEQESIVQNWSARALERQKNTLYYERLLATRDKKAVVDEAIEKTTDLKLTPEELIKNPYMLEFLDMRPDLKYLEKEIEQGLMDKLQEFLLELGKGFAFVARQRRMSTEHSEFFIDLVFYNFLLKCFVLIDIKTTKLTHQDVGQMDMYVRMYEDKYRGPNDNPTIGIILCAEKDEAIVKYSILKESKQLFASKYFSYLPTEEELKRELLRERQLIELEQQLRTKLTPADKA